MPRLGVDEARRRFAAAPVARLGTVTATGRPHLVPIVFAVAGADSVLFAVDGKPKRHRDLARLRHIADDPRVCVIVDRYDDDWSQLWWVRADGRAVVDEDDAALDRARALLAARYPQHRADPPQGPVVTIAVERWTGWSASATGSPPA